MNKKEFTEMYGTLTLGALGDYVRCLELRGKAKKDDARIEAKAEAQCNMGVGCGTAGICYAEKMGRPECCGRRRELKRQGFEE